jgi:hypothetical protein
LPQSDALPMVARDDASIHPVCFFDVHNLKIALLTLVAAVQGYNITSLKIIITIIYCIKGFCVSLEILRRRWFRCDRSGRLKIINALPIVRDLYVCLAYREILSIPAYVLARAEKSR